MPRKLKTYVTSVGFFDQAIAAPSMKAALEAWGAAKNSFHHGFAEETDDPAIVKATMAKPGVVLKRAVGSNDPFTENPELPKSLPAGRAHERSIYKPKTKGRSAQVKNAKPAEIISLADARAAKQAAAAYEKGQARREKENEKREAAEQKVRQRRDAAVEKAEARLVKARKQHEATMAEIAVERDALDRREQEEAARWDKEKKKLETAQRRAGG